LCANCRVVFHIHQYENKEYKERKSFIQIEAKVELQIEIKNEDNTKTQNEDNGTNKLLLLCNVIH
jgi:hypothetical protein